MTSSSMLARRHFLSGVAIACATTLAARARAEGGVRLCAKTSRDSARYFVQIALGGGIDSVYTTDPKVKGDIEGRVDVPYGPSAIVEADGHRFGPHFAKLRPFAKRLTIVNGVYSGTVGHPTGHQRLSRLKLDAASEMPTFTSVLGSHRDSQPLGSVNLGVMLASVYSDAMFSSTLAPIPGGGDQMMDTRGGRTLLDVLDALSPEELTLASRTLVEKASAATAGDAKTLRTSAALMAKLATTPKFKVEQWSTVQDAQAMATFLQRALWLIEHDLTATAHVQIGGLEWDAHFSNASRQERWTGLFVPMYIRFLDELAKRSTARGSLADLTDVMVSSEMGRFPLINESGGKDHLPEYPMIFTGPTFRCAAGKAFGQTGRKMEALPIATSTGKPGGPNPIRPNIEDVGTTILALRGIDPGPNGYAGRVLSF